MKWFINVIKKYADFGGRARRKEYWMYMLFYFIFAIIASIVDALLFTAEFGPVYGLYALALLLPSLAVSVRRLHDSGKSGWYMLVLLIPIVGVIWLLILMCQDSSFGENRFGLNPKEQM